MRIKGDKDQERDGSRKRKIKNEKDQEREGNEFKKKGNGLQITIVKIIIPDSCPRSLPRSLMEVGRPGDLSYDLSYASMFIFSFFFNYLQKESNTVRKILQRIRDIFTESIKMAIKKRHHIGI